MAENKSDGTKKSGKRSRTQNRNHSSRRYRKNNKEQVKEVKKQNKVKEVIVEPVTEIEIKAPVVNTVVNEIPLDSYFDGGVLGLIGYRLLRIILSSCSLGILAPLGSVLLLRWQYSHTVINGRRLVFTGTYLQLLGRMLCWILLSIVTLGIYLFFIPVSWNNWVISHLHYEDNDNKVSKFTGTTLQFLGVFVLSLLLIIFSFGLLYPCAICYIKNWRIKHMVIDDEEMEFDGHAIQAWGLYLKWGILTIITLGIYGFWVPVNRIKWETKHTNKKGISKKPYNPILAVLVPILVSLIIFICLVCLAIIPYFVFKNNASTHDNSKMSYSWSEKYYNYLKKHNDYENLEGAFIDFDNNGTPELVLREYETVCFNCDAMQTNINILYLKNNKVNEVSLYDRANLVAYYDMELASKDWYIIQYDDSYYKITDLIKGNEVLPITVKTKEERDIFNKRYLNLEANVNFRVLPDEKMKKNIDLLAKGFSNNKAYSILSDEEVNSKVKEIKDKEVLLDKATLTNENLTEKIDKHVKWFVGAFLGETYGWPLVFEYKEVNDVVIPGHNEDEMVYEVVGLKSINDLKEQLALYVARNKFSSFSQAIGYRLTEYNNKVYWLSLGVGDGPYLKDYTLESSDNGISKVRVNIWDHLSNNLYEYIILTIEYQEDSDSYLITDWDVLR